MKKQTQYFINGIILLALALLSITFLPVWVNRIMSVEKLVFSQVEFFLLIAGAIFFLFSPKYYKWQFWSIIAAFGLYWCFLKYYPILF